ncbi:MAG TPA: hypothetical protein VK616_02375 [Flavitalea sp.]|nr:hypothetical protein [Flavitalea sp.]
MNKRLEDFINENREQFDTDEPAPHVWKNIEKDLVGAEKKTFFKIPSFQRWVAAAAVVISISTGAYFILSPKNNVADLSNNNGPDQPAATQKDILDQINPTYAKEVYHFTQLIELKQNELKLIEKDQPELYRQFMSDITQLDSSYNSLQKELPANPNREQLLEAMIQNLQLQTELLNQQLRVIKQIKQSKSKTNESNSKSI